MFKYNHDCNFTRYDTSITRVIKTTTYFGCGFRMSF